MCYHIVIVKLDSSCTSLIVTLLHLIIEIITSSYTGIKEANPNINISNTHNILSALENDINSANKKWMA